MTFFADDKFSIAVGIMVAVTMLLVILICSNVIPVRSVAGFASRFTPRSEPVRGMLTSGASMRMQGTGLSQGYNQDGWKEGLITGKRQSFLGGPEPPVFYDIGDVSATHSAVEQNMGKPNEGGDEGFARDQINSRDLNPY